MNLRKITETFFVISENVYDAWICTNNNTLELIDKFTVYIDGYFYMVQVDNREISVSQVICRRNLYHDVDFRNYLDWKRCDYIRFYIWDSAVTQVAVLNAEIYLKIPHYE